MLEYEVVAHRTILDLSREVNAAIAQGWTPCGGVATEITYGPPSGPMYSAKQETVFLQAITRQK